MENPFRKRNNGGSDGFHLRAYVVLPDGYFGKNPVTQKIASLIPDTLKLYPENMTLGGFAGKVEAQSAAGRWQKELNHKAVSGGKKHYVKVLPGLGY